MANVVVAVVASAAAAAGDVDVDWSAAAAADGMNVIDSYPEVAFRQAVGTSPGTTSLVPVVQCLVPYFPPRKARRKCKSENFLVSQINTALMASAVLLVVST